jgi:hypothetical protein
VLLIEERLPSGIEEHDQPFAESMWDGDHNLGDLGSGAGAIWWAPTPRGIVGERGPYGLGMAVHDANPPLAASFIMRRAGVSRGCYFLDGVTPSWRRIGSRLLALNAPPPVKENGAFRRAPPGPNTSTGA